MEKNQYTGAFNNLSEQEQKATDETIKLLVSGKPLPQEYHDHALKGQPANLHDCHVRHDLVLIYEIDRDSKTLICHNIGKHNRVFI